MTKHTISRSAAILISLATVFAYTGCKESSILNTNITPAGDSLHIDGEEVEFDVRTVMSSFITSQYFTGVPVVLGAGLISSDPEVGSTDSRIYFQVIPPQSSGYALPANIDSFVVVLPYVGYTYGDTQNATALTYEVYQMTDGMAKTDTFFNDSYKTFDSTNALGTTTLQYATLRDSMSIEGKNVVPHLRIKLDSAAIASRLNAANYNSYLDFLNSFKGLCVRTTNSSGNIIPYFRMTDDGGSNSVSKAGIVVYYHETGSPDVKYNVIGYDPNSTSHFNRVIQDPGTTLDTSNFTYFQSRPGLSIEITTKGLATMSTRMVNKAEVIIPQVPGLQQADKYVAPTYLFPYIVKPNATSDGHELLENVTDAIFTSSAGESVSGLSFINGATEDVTLGGQSTKQYVINIPKEIQKAILEKREMKIRITGVASGYPGAYRTKSGKNEKSDPFRIRMNVVYSKL